MREGNLREIVALRQTKKVYKIYLQLSSDKNNSYYYVMRNLFVDGMTTNNKRHPFL